MDVRIVVKTREQMARFIEQIRCEISPLERSDGRRAHWRFAYAIPAAVELEDPPVLGEPIYITTRDISVDGLGFVSHYNLRPGQKVLICVDANGSQLEVPATVMHSTISVGMYKVGVEFDFDDS